MLSSCYLIIDDCLLHCFAYLLFCSFAPFFSSDISKVGVWEEAQKLSDPELAMRVPQLLDLILASSAPSTSTRYSYGWTRWRRWAQSKQGVSFMPASPLCIAMYLLELTEDGLQKNVGCSAIDSALYGIRWAHKMAGLESPTVHPTVVAAAEGARRKLSKPVQPKQPLDLETVVKVAQSYNTALASLADIRFLFVLLVGYAGLFRISELLTVKVKDISLACQFLSPRERMINFVKGILLLLPDLVRFRARFQSLRGFLLCWQVLKILVLRRIVRTKNGAYFHKSFGISYSTIRDEFKKYISPFVNDLSDYCLHSLKSGGASNDGYKLCDPELKDRHAGWKNPCTKKRYIKRSHTELLEITKSMGI